MTPILVLYAWAQATVETVNRRLHKNDPDGDAGMTTMEILIWLAVGVVAAGIIAAAIWAWLSHKSNGVTQQ
jgi:hypothetical protein